MEVVKKTDIQAYAKRNTSPKMPIEELYVNAFIDALMNSTSVQQLYSTLADEMQNGDAFIIFNSYSTVARNLNKEPYRSIIAYAMLKKDIRLFELISASMFTGSVVEYHGSDLYVEVTKTTDESPTKYTDSGLYTDMSEGLIQMGFKNIYANDPLPDGTGSEYQTSAELESAIFDFDYIITLTKPARVEVLLFFVPYCFIGGNQTTLETVGIDRDDENFSSPFGDKESMDIIDAMSDSELADLYKEVTMFDYNHQIQRDITYERKVVRGKDYLMFTYEFRTQSTEVKDPETGIREELIWSTIRISSNTSSITYIKAKKYDVNETYYERYNPIMLRINDDDPEGPCLALQIENDVPTVGAMFYTRDKVK